MECIPVTEKRQGRKRLRDVESWKKNKTKIAKDSGEIYKTYKGDVVDAKNEVRLTCHCHYHCTSRVNSKEKERIFSDEQYLHGLIMRSSPRKKKNTC